MILSGVLSTMNVWANSIDDIRLSLNDAYMIGLMTGYMILFMGVYYQYTLGSLVGLGLVCFFFYAIRTQLFITEHQFLVGMIPHHSMAIHMSKQLQTKPNHIPQLLTNIITSQESEIEYMKQREKI